MPTTRGITFAVLALIACANPAWSQQPCGTWTPVAMPDAAGRMLTSVSASSASDAWAAGRGVYHWNGIAWSAVTTPGLVSPDSQGYADTTLAAVAAVAPGDAWIVGSTSFLGTPQTFAERWNGSQWSVVPSPIIAGGSTFDAVAALGPNDAWAVGIRAGGLPEYSATSVTLTAHWNGSSWTAVPSPNVSNRSHRLEDVAMVASNDVWAVGYSRNLTELYRTLILHWNGSSWSVTPSPNLPGENFLHGVSAVSANDVWAVGYAWDGVTTRQIFLHWNGSAWSQVEGPGGATACVGCTADVLAMGPNDVWASGSTIGHWNGTAWTLLPNPEMPGSLGMALRSLARVGACDAWAVGSRFDLEGADHALSVRLGNGTVIPNLAPVAVANATPSSGPGPLEVQFSSAGTHDPDGTIVSYHWNFGDSSYPPEQSEANPVHTFLQTGSLTYQVTLEVRDNDGAVTETSVEVRITPPLHVESQEVVEVQAPGSAYARNVVEITDRDGLAMAGVAVTAQYRGPMSGIVSGTTGSNGLVMLETPPAAETDVPWCFEVIDVAKAGCIYVASANKVTEQCESGNLDATLPRELALRVSPNPMRGEGVVQLSLPSARDVRVAILDLSGRQVREIVHAPLGAGSHTWRWDGRSDAGQATPAGVYFVTVTAGDRSLGTRVLRLR